MAIAAAIRTQTTMITCMATQKRGTGYSIRA